MYSAFYRRMFAVSAVILLGYALLKIMDPFWGALGWAAFLAFLMHPVHKALTRKLRGRDGVSAGIIVALTPFLIMAPLAALGVVFASQVAHLVEFLRGRQLPSYPALLERLEAVPLIGRAVQWVSSEASVTAEQVQEWAVNGAQTALKTAASMSGSVALGVVGTLVGFALMLFLFFFLLRDGKEMLGHITRLIPMERHRRRDLIDYLGNVTRAVVYGSALTALIQGTLVGIGFAFAGLPSPVVFGVLATIAAFIPAAGTGFVLIPGVLYLALTGHWGSAIFLGIWSVAVGFSDNILRPMLAATRAEVSSLAVFVGVIGGVSAFGFIGLFLGPVLLSLIVALIKFAEESVVQTTTAKETAAREAAAREGMAGINKG